MHAPLFPERFVTLPSPIAFYPVFFAFAEKVAVLRGSEICMHSVRPRQSQFPHVAHQTLCPLQIGLPHPRAVFFTRKPPARTYASPYPTRKNDRIRISWTPVRVNLPIRSLSARAEAFWEIVMLVAPGFFLLPLLPDLLSLFPLHFPFSFFKGEVLLKSSQPGRLPPFHMEHRYDGLRILYSNFIRCCLTGFPALSAGAYPLHTEFGAVPRRVWLPPDGLSFLEIVSTLILDHPELDPFLFPRR